ncbi:MAG: cytochrome P450 [Chloroflexi bacterium]|nr:cytochrome P450 [Chloroflexota bacterium]
MTLFRDSDLDQSLLSPAFARDPYPTLRRLREEHPVYWSEAIGGWLLTRFDDVMVTFRDVTHFSNEGRLGKAVEYLPDDVRAGFGPFEAHYRTRGLLHSDPPVHTRLRTLVRDPFSPRAVEQLRPSIQAIVDELLDRVQAAGSMDVIADLAIPLPATVIAQIFGVPPEDTHRFVGWSDDVLAFQGQNRPSVAWLQRAQEALIELRSYLADLINARRAEPTDDLLSALVTPGPNGDRLSDDELLNTSVTLLVAGHETTRSLIGNGLYLLLADADRWQRLRSHPELLKPAIEEALRYESPVARQPRRMRESVTLGGMDIRAGDMVFQMLNAANRDPERFPDPEVFVIDRSSDRHIAFGNGIHFCLGASLARLEGSIALASLMERMPDLRLIDPEPDWALDKQNSRLLNRLPVRF